MTSKSVYVLDAWNETTQTAVILVFAARQNALRALERVVKRPGKWYAGVVRRSIR